MSRVAGRLEGSHTRQLSRFKPDGAGKTQLLLDCIDGRTVVASYERYGVVYNGEVTKDHVGVSRLDYL